MTPLMNNESIDIFHKPVLLNETLDYLNLSPGKLIVDCTVGGGGHAAGILEKVTPGGFLLGIDRDKEVLEVSAKRLDKYENAFKLVHRNFKDIDLVMKDLNITSVDGFLFDLGFSSYQLEIPERGFSFRLDGPLDMRMDRTQKLTARDLINSAEEDSLTEIIKEYSEERFARNISRWIVSERRKKDIETTGELLGIITRAIPKKFQHGRLHPATRTFQALRIAVNNELENLSSILDKILPFLSKGARIAVISFHSLEDRIVKNKLRELSKSGSIKIITKKPVIPSDEEVSFNPHSRSAKLRIGERL